MFCCLSTHSAIRAPATKNTGNTEIGKSERNLMYHTHLFLFNSFKSWLTLQSPATCKRYIVLVHLYSGFLFRSFANSMSLSSGPLLTPVHRCEARRGRSKSATNVTNFIQMALKERRDGKNSHKRHSKSATDEEKLIQKALSILKRSAND